MGAPDLMDRMNQLQATLSKMEVALAMIAEAVLWTAEDGRIQGCNSSCARLLNRSHSSIINAKLEDLLPLKQAGQNLTPELYPDNQIRNQQYETTQYEWQQGDRTLILEISGKRVESVEANSSVVLVMRDITQTQPPPRQQQRVEQEREKLVSLLRATLESTADGILVVNPDRNTPIYNQKFLQLWGIPESLMLPDKADERLRILSEKTKDPEEFITRVWQLFRERPEETALELLEFKDGRILERYSQPQWIGNQIVGRVWSFRDVTEHKQTEQIIQKSEERLKLALEAGHMGIWDWHILTGEVKWSDNLEAVHGMPPGSFGGTFADFLEIVHPQDREWVSQTIAEAVETGAGYDIEFRILWADGSIHWIAGKGQTFPDSTGQPIRMIGLGMDVTQRKQAEAALRRSNALLKAQQEASIDGILVVDEDQRVAFYNQRFCQLWQIPAAVIQTGSDRQLLRWVLDQLVQPEAFLARVEYLYDHPEESSQDEIALKDGRTLERYSAAVRSRSTPGEELPAGDYYGRVWYFRDVSEAKRDELVRRQSEAALRLSELKFRHLFENSQIGIFRSRVEDGLILDANQRFIELSGYGSAAEVIEQKSTTEFYVDPSYRQWIVNQLHQHGKLNNFEMQYRRRDGSCRWGLFSLYLNAAENCLEAVVTDITDRKWAEEALQASEAQYRDLVQTANSIILRWDTVGKIRFLNEYGQRFFGFQAEEILGSNVVGTIVPQTETSGRDLAALMIDIRQHPENYLLNENENLCKNGNRVWVAWANKPILDEQGNLVEILSVGTDATQRKQAEAALAESEAKFRNIVENANDIIFVINREGVFSYISPNLFNITGYQPAELEDSSFIPLIYADDLPKCLAAVNKVVTTGERQSGIEYRIKYKDDHYYWQVSNLAPAQDATGNPMIIGIAHDITDRKQSEEALRRSELKYRHIFENSQMGIGRTRLENGLFLEANQRCAEIMGYSSATELIGRHFSTNFYAQASDRQQMMTELRQQGEVSNFELQLRHQDGSTSWALLSLRLNDEEGCIDFVIADISDRKHREEALRLIVEGTASKTGNEFFQSCARYLAEVLRVRYALVTAFTDETKTKVRSLAFWGGEAIGDNFEYNPQGAPCEGVLLGKMCYYPEGLQALFPDDPDLVAIGAESYLGVPLTDAAGNILGHLAVMDVKPMERDPGRELILRIFAARTGAELERQQADEALQRRAQLERLISSISRQFIDQDVDTAINFTLAAIADFTDTERSCIFEYSQDQSRILLTHEWCAAGVQPLSSQEVLAEALPQFHRLLMSGKAMQVPCIADLPPGTPERALFESQSIQSALSVPMIHADRVVGFISADTVHFARTWNQEEVNLLKLVGELIAIGRARHKAEEALRVAKEAAEAANRAKSTFLANMSHELRTPLNAILGFAQLMERDAALSSRQRESLAIINRSGEHLLSLINDVLEMSKIEAGRIVLNPTPFDLHRLLQTLREMFQIRAEAKQLSLSFKVSPGLPQYVLTDEGKLRQVLINLLSNAVKFTASGSVALRVKAAARKSKHLNLENETEHSAPYTLYFEVEDTGKGIAPEEVGKLFQPFMQTTSGTQAREGTGLGLTISRQFVQLMGGDIHYSSVVGQGSSFHFQIQVTLANPPAEATQSFANGRVLGLVPGQPAYRVLVVDDKQDNRDLLTQLFSTVGFETRTAVDGRAAIAEWQQWQPHLIWMDMRMPVMDGYQATQQIRNLETLSTLSGQGQNTVIIALTASAFEEQRANILAAGCDDLVRKPFREQVLFDKMAEHLGIQFVYGQQPSPPGLAPQSHKGRRESLTFSNLAVMPAKWIGELHQAAVEVDADKIVQLIAQIPEADLSLAEGLTELVRHFCFDEILELTEGEYDV
jgi:two-component system sensor histidine kinase/response regulator